MNTTADQIMEADPPSMRTTQYFPVSTSKFIILGLLTFGFYELYWFWKNWRFIKSRDESNILPWGRALFCVFWYPALLSDLRRSSESGETFRGGVILLSASYFFLLIFSRLPDPFWLIALVSFLPLLPAVREINRRNPSPNFDYERNSSWRLRHGVLALVMLPILAYLFASSTMLMPSADVVPGWALMGRAQSFLEKNVLENDEDVLFFYAGGLFSFSEDGNLLTDTRVVTYWEDVDTDEFYLEGAAFSEIANIEVVDGSWMDDAVVTIHRHDGSAFNLVLPGYDEASRRFIRRLNELVRSQQSAP